MRASLAAAPLAAVLVGLPTARAQMGVSPYHTGRPDTRNPHAKALDGDSVDDWAKRLESDNARERLLAVEDLGQSDDPHAVTYLLKAMGDRDLRVQARAIDYLGAHRASDATPLLVQKLYLKGAPDGLRQHVLTALGRIGDPTASRPILDFLSQEANPKLRGTGIYALGEIGDLSVQDDLRKIGDQEIDPRLKSLVADALTKIARPPKQQYVPPSADVAPLVR
ncbi:MAG: HEAT repeat domain-containing protein [Candidatus Binatia bacterium]